MSSDNDIKHATHPVAIDNDPTGVYICARDAEVWHRALSLALDPYKAPEIRAAADHSLGVLRNLLRDAVSGINVREIETKETP